VIVLQLAAILIGVGAMATAVHVAGRWPAVPRPPQRHRRSMPLPVELDRCQQLVGGLSSAGDVQHRLRPALRAVAAVRLRAAGIGLDADPACARERLGDELWEIVRTGRPAPEDRTGPGISRSELSRLLDRLEAL